MDGPARVKALTKFGSDFVIPGKMIGACTHILGTACVKARGLRTLEGVAGMMVDDFAIAEAVVAASEIEGVVLQHAVTEFMEADAQVARVSNIIRPLKIVIDEIRNVYKGVIPFDRVDLKKELEFLLKEVQQNLKKIEIEKVKKLYGQKIIDNKLVKPNFDHILNFEFGFDKSRKFGGYVLELKGGHIAEVWEQLEQTGLVKIIQKDKLATGAIDYILQDLITGKKITKTVFPVSWTEEKIAKAMWDVYENGKTKITDIGNIYKYKNIDEKFEMSMILKFSEQKHGSSYLQIVNIKTVLPYWKFK